ncbi:clustered with transcription termination protein NusA [Desulfocucumis palustris]|uniref:Ribosome maturation factor RimP n=1 Tax=Desulfocucumis palustris TaxID=1898651 RepID=A0A2L2XFN1_9FIRM|nr:ribosome maturation factor RimP [Desulfocucumis palustris]GBF32671.1 clustered with transcription termination protein NusA [Desulfocucumis palustris]
MARSNIAGMIEDLIAPLIGGMGIELVDVEFVKEGNRHYLRVFIDKPGGVGLDDCQAVSEKLDVFLDEKDPVPYSYTLEVSSPGIERPLKKVKDFERFCGHKVNITTFAPVKGSKKFTGIITDAGSRGVNLDINGSELFIPMEQLASAKLAVEF